jgi:hypothetical protein
MEDRKKYFSRDVKSHKSLRNNHCKAKWFPIWFPILIVSLLLIEAAVWFTLHSPEVSDPESGISISIPHNSISVFDKWNISIDAAVESVQSNAYSEAKNALRNETLFLC